MSVPKAQALDLMAALKASLATSRPAPDEPESGSPEAVEQAPRHTPGPWEREGTTVYALMHAGWDKGQEVFKNRFTVQVFGDRECPPEELEANAALIARAWELPDLEQRLRDGEAEEARLQKQIVILGEVNRELADALDTLCFQVGKLGGSISEELFQAFKAARLVLRRKAGRS